MRSLARLFPSAALCFLIACASGGKVPDNGDAGPMDDAMVPIDADTRAGFGEPCEYHTDCVGLCYHADTSDPMGVCTDECDGMCPDGYACEVVMIDPLTESRICVEAEENFCANCETNADCGDSGDFCVELTAGRFCTVDCAGDPSVCPTGFTCQSVAGAGDTVVGMQCMPINGICCIDGDGDLRGEGAGCVTTDCDDANDVVYDDAVEVCDTFDNDCIGGVDVDVTDCAGDICQLGMFGYYSRPGEPCVNGTCELQNAVLCDLYTCSEGGELGDTCATSCDGEDDSKCIPTAHCDNSVCYSDLADGQMCDEDSDCANAHCQNGFCCAFGDCCQMASDCPTFGTFDPVCENPATCQGSRGEAICGPTFICGSSGTADDDSACDMSTVADDCGFYLDVMCNGQADQVAPACATSCSSHADCDPGAFCDPGTNICVQDLINGSFCANDAERCQSGHCQNQFCCDSGDCCANESDCPPSYSGPAVCDVPSACQGERDIAQCNNFECSTSVGVDDDSACDSSIVANTCGLYNSVNCDGNSVQNPPLCPSTCSTDLDCDADAYCSAGGACVPDEPDGVACMDNDECQSGHCQNGACCDSGDCCTGASDCSAYGVAPVCDDATSCQGHRRDGVCNAQSQCEQSMDIADDSACTAVLEANDCGPYPSVFCSGDVTQNAPICTSMCSGDGDCDPSAHCDGGTCVPDAGQGGFCDEPSDCDAGLFCVDNVCCNSSCNSGCEACDLAGSVGTCSLVPDGQDPDNECGAVACGGFYDGFSGNTCYQKADVSAGAATCAGNGQCRTAAQECGASGRGPGVLTCDNYCQDPTGGTCSGTTAGACTNVSQGNHSCGQGVCAVTVPQCISGSFNTCVPDSGQASTETCNNIDDNCNGVTDDGSFSDSSEPNGSCSNYTTLAQVGSDQTLSIDTKTIYGSGDNDYYRINARETDGSCGGCDGLFDEDYRIHLTLTVPSGAGSYMFCTGNSDCGNVNSNCQEVLAGQAATWIWTLDGGCGTGNDSFTRYVRIYGDNAPGYECLPYTFSYRLETGCFDGVRLDSSVVANDIQVSSL